MRNEGGGRWVIYKWTMGISGSGAASGPHEVRDPSHTKQKELAGQRENVPRLMLTFFLRDTFS